MRRSQRESEGVKGSQVRGKSQRESKGVKGSQVRGKSQRESVIREWDIGTLVPKIGVR